MSLGDIFKAKENETLKSRIAELEGMLTPEMRDSMQLQEKINYQEKLLTSLQADCAKTQADQTALLDKSKSELSAIEDQIRQARSRPKTPSFCNLSDCTSHTTVFPMRPVTKRLLTIYAPSKRTA